IQQIRPFLCVLQITQKNRTSTKMSTRYDQLETAFHRISRNTSIDTMEINTHYIHNVQADFSRFINSIVKFKIETLSLTTFENEDHECELLELLGFDSSSLLTLATNVTHANIRFECASVNGRDLCRIRQMMLNHQCKLESLSILVDHGDESFLKECFGLTIEFNWHPFQSRIYRSSDASLQMFSIRPNTWLDVLHYEGNFGTLINRTFSPLTDCTEQLVTFSTHDQIEVDRKKWSYRLIKFNHIYR
ncbi:hypothetical protein PFISCL1PPCAC_19185, partial [Pristionchus fissidentatus]